MVKEIRKIYAVKVWKMVDFFAWKLTKLQGDNFWRRKAVELGETISEKDIFLGPTFSVAKMRIYPKMWRWDGDICTLVSIVTFFENILVYNWLMFGAITFKRDRNLPKTSFLVILTLWYQRNWKKATVWWWNGYPKPWFQVL